MCSNCILLYLSKISQTREISSEIQCLAARAKWNNVFVWSSGPTIAIFRPLDLFLFKDGLCATDKEFPDGNMATQAGLIGILF